MRPLWRNTMHRRNFLAAGSAGLLTAATKHPSRLPINACDCSFAPQAGPVGLQAFSDVSSGLKITGVKVFGVSLTPNSDRPYVFVKLETNQGLVGWGEGTLEGKAGSVMACINDFRDFVIGADPIMVEHHWQSMYVHSFYRAGPVIGSAISGIDQALLDLRGKLFGLPVYRLLGGPFDARGVRGYYHAQARDRAQLEELRESAIKLGVTCFKDGLPGYFERIATRVRIHEAVAHVRLLREGLDPTSTSASTCTPRPARRW